MNERNLRLGSLLAALLLTLGLVWLPWTELLDLKLLDRQFEFLRRVRPVPAAGVLLVGVDEATVKAYPEPMVLWHRHLADLIRGLGQGGARGIGLDFNLPDRSFDAILPGLDSELLRGILTARRETALVLGVTVESDFRVRPIHAPFLAAAGDQGTGLVLFPVDPDRYVRRFEEPRRDDGSASPTLAGQLARRLGLPVSTGYLDFSLGEPLSYVPMHQVVSWFRSGDQASLLHAFQGKVVFVGGVLPLVDRHYMPVNLAGWEDNRQFAPGVLLHVQAMRSLLGRGFVQRVPWLGQLLAALVAVVLVWWAGRRPLTGLLAFLACSAAALALAHTLLRSGRFLPVVAILAGAALAFLARSLAESWGKFQERRRLRQVFGGYVSPAILDEILSGRIRPGLAGRRMAVCVMFTDIRGFTHLSEGLPPEEVIAILNRYFDAMAETIHRHGGTLDKFMGDGIMAFFGAPLPLAAPCEAAFATARDMLAALAELNRGWDGRPWPELQIGIGMDFGEVAVGHVGSESRHEYTAIGDVVNIASRVEGLTRDSGYPVLVSARWHAALAAGAGSTVRFDPLGEHAIKGHAPMPLFGWPAHSPDEPTR